MSGRCHRRRPITRSKRRRWSHNHVVFAIASIAMSKRAGSKVVEVKGSHSVYVSKPEEVAALIETAAKGVKVAAR